MALPLHGAEAPHPLYIPQMGRTVREVVDRSGVFTDYPPFNGQRQVLGVTIDSDVEQVAGRSDGLATPVPSGARIRENADLFGDLLRFMHQDAEYTASTSGARYVHEGYLAALYAYDRIYGRVRGDILALAEIAQHAVDGMPTVTVLLPVWMGHNSSNGGCPILLQVIQRVHDELADRVDMRRVVLFLEPSIDDRLIERWTRSLALTLTLEAARYGLEVAPGQILKAPFAELAIVHGTHDVLESLDAQHEQVAAIIRALADPLIGDALFALLPHLDPVDLRADAPAYLRGFGLGTYLAESGRVDLLADIILRDTDAIQSTEVLA